MCKLLNIHQRAKESLAGVPDSLYSPLRRNVNVALLYHVSYFSAVQYSPFAALRAAAALKWSALTCALVSAGSRAGRELDCVAMNGGGNASPDLSARLASVQ